MKETTLLDEQGIIITTAQISTASHRIPLSNIKSLRMVKAPPENLLGLLKKRPVHLFVNDFKQEQSIFETLDEALIERIKIALTRAQSTHVDNKRIVRPR